MSLYDAYVAADGALGWKSEVAARIRDFLARNKAVGEGVLSLVERAVESTVPFDRVRESLAYLKTLLVRRRAVGPGAQPIDPELEVYFQRILEHGNEGTIEDYPAYMITVDSEF